MISLPDFKVKKTSFSNGLRLLAIPGKDVKTLTLLVIVGVGSHYENKKNNGISHFLEHVMFKGTEKRPSTKDLSEELDSIGAEYNAFTSNEATAYYIKAASFHADQMFDILSDMVLHSKFEEKEIEKEKGVIIEEVNMINDVPMDKAGMLFDKASFGDQPAGWPVIGTKENISSFSQKDFLDYYQKFYTSKNTLVIVSGDIKPQEAIAKTRKYFGNTKRGEKNKKADVIKKQDKPQLLIEKSGTDQTHLVVGFKGYDIFSEKRFAARVLASVLGGNMSSRLFLEIREQRGLAYYIGTTVDSLLDSGMFYTRAGIKNENVEDALKAILEEHKKIKEKGITTKELNKTKDYLISKMILGLETSDELADFFGRQEIFRKQITSPKRLASQIKRVTIGDVQKVAHEMFVPQKLVLAAVGPVDEKKIKAILNSF